MFKKVNSLNRRLEDRLSLSDKALRLRRTMLDLSNWYIDLDDRE